jgi:hypothetical protein
VPERNPPVGASSPKGDSGPPEGGPVRRRLRLGVLGRSMAVVIYAGSMSALSAQEAPSRHNEIEATSSNTASGTHLALGVATENRASGFVGALSFSKAPQRTPVLTAGELDWTGSGARSGPLVNEEAS